MANMPAPAPVVTPETQKFWDATARGVLLLPKCNNCGTVIWYPRELCPDCSSFDVSWIEASGKGTIYSYSITRRPTAVYRGEWIPYVLAYVELEEGPRMITHIVDCDPESLECGQAVQVVFHDTGEGNALPRFTPA